MKETIISRTVKNSTATVLKVDTEKRTVSELTIVINSNIDTVEKAMSYFLKHDRTIVDVISVDTVETLVGMTESDFLKYGTVFEERSKENRGMVSKVVKCRSSVCMIVNKERKVESISVASVDEKAIRKYCDTIGVKFVMVEKTEETEKLVCMTQEDFVKHSRPMKDRFTLTK